jgi:hypothetical protein
MEFNDVDISKQYEEKLKNLNAGINILLDDFKKIYVIAKMNPTDQEYQQQFQSKLNSLDEILSQLFIISNDVDVNIDSINKKLLELNILITRERNRNEELKRKLRMVENTNNASSEMISDYKNMYNYNYLRNWSLIISSLLCIGTIGVVYKQRV